MLVLGGVVVITLVEESLVQVSSPATAPYSLWTAEDWGSLWWSLPDGGGNGGGGGPSGAGAGASGGASGGKFVPGRVRRTESSASHPPTRSFNFLDVYLFIHPSIHSAS